MQIRLPGDSSSQRSILDIQASGIRSQARLDNGESWYWGGYFYKDFEKASIYGFNLLNEEDGLSSVLSGSNKMIVSHGMGFAHDAVLVQEAPSVITQ